VSAAAPVAIISSRTKISGWMEVAIPNDGRSAIPVEQGAHWKAEIVAQFTEGLDF